MKRGFTGHMEILPGPSPSCPCKALRTYQQSSGRRQMAWPGAQFRTWAAGRGGRMRASWGGGRHQAWSVPISCSPAVQLRLGHPTCLSSSLLSNESGGFSDLKRKRTQGVGLGKASMGSGQDHLRGWGHPPSPTSPGAPSLLSHAKARLASGGLYHRHLLPRGAGLVPTCAWIPALPPNSASHLTGLSRLSLKC